MARKNDNQDNRKHRKEQKIMKSKGNFKKLNNKSLKPPDLSQFKSRMIQSLKSKQANHDKTINNLQNVRKLQLHHFMNQNAEDYVEDIEEEQDGKEIIKKGTYLQTHKYFGLMKKVIQSCDIILQILDARDPLSCRCKYIQRKIQSMPDKKIIIILNKIDLVPVENAYAWQTYLRRQFPVVLFKANLQNQSQNLSSFNLYNKSFANSTQLADTLIHSTKAIGAQHLIQLIKQISKVQGSSRAVTVGVIGYPNVGKSSVINSLKRSKTCQVSTMPGCTKNLKQIKLDKQVKLLDCPGVIFQKQLTKNQLILQNTTRVQDQLEEVIEAILERIPTNEINQFYQIQPYTSTTDFLAKICRKYGKLGKGGVPQLKQGAKHVVQDWNRGKLKYFTFPPLAQERQKQMNEAKNSMVEQ